MVDSDQFNAMLKSFKTSVPKKSNRNRSQKKIVPKMDPNNTDYSRNHSKVGKFVNFIAEYFQNTGKELKIKIPPQRVFKLGAQKGSKA